MNRPTLRAPDGNPPESKPLADQLRGLGPIGLLAIGVILAGNLLFLPLSAILVLIWAHASNTPYASLGFAAPRSWVLVAVAGIVFGIAFKLVMKSLVMPLLGAPPINPRYQYITGNAAALPAIFYAVVVGAGFGEETVFRGFLFDRLGRLFGRGRPAVAGIVVLTASLFAIAHYPEQGWPGVEQAMVVGLVFGAIYAWTRRLWFVMFAHTAFDVTAVTLIYRGWEARVAHWFIQQ